MIAGSIFISKAWPLLVRPLSFQGLCGRLEQITFESQTPNAASFDCQTL